MGGAGSGSKKGQMNIPEDKKINSKIADPKNNNPQGTIAAIEFGKYLMDLPPIDLSDAEAVEERFQVFLNVCAEHDFRPMVTGLAMAFGINRARFAAIVRGDKQYEGYKGITPQSRIVLQKAYDFMEYFMDFNLENESGNPVKWFFLAKNHFGYKDQSERIERFIDETPRLTNPAELAEKYLTASGNAEVIEVEATIEDETPTLPTLPTFDSATFDSEGGK